MNILQYFIYLHSLVIYYIFKWITHLQLSLKRITQKKYCRCTHSHEHDKDFHLLLQKHNREVEQANNNGRVMLGNSEKPIDLGSGQVTIEIPIVFHFVDPILQASTVAEWELYINREIIPVLNNDYNVSYERDKTSYLQRTSDLFSHAAESKKKYYLDLVNVFPCNLNVKWKFRLDRILERYTYEYYIDDKNDDVYHFLRLQDPESYLNIAIVRSKSILGISTFPFSDRDPVNPHQIDPQYKFRNGILIHTDVFLKKLDKYNLFKTFTHEIGHWCGLLHPFDNQTFMSNDIKKFGLDRLYFDHTPEKEDKNFKGDLITDTSLQTNPTFGTVVDHYCKVKTKVGNRVVENWEHYGPYASIFEDNKCLPNFYNYMDYTDDCQLIMFTKMQILHMIYMLCRFRPRFVKS